MPMQYTEIFNVLNNENFHLKFVHIFLIFAPQSMFWSKNKKNRTGIPLQTPVFFYVKIGFKGVYISRI